MQPNPSTLPHIYWCLSGPGSALPIHAACMKSINRRKTVKVSWLADYAVSSYIPSITALKRAQARQPQISGINLLAVAQPEAPGAAPLPYTTSEIAGLDALFQERLAAQNRITRHEEKSATIAAVTEDLKICTHVHLACHGTQDKQEPLASGFLLFDGRLRLDQVIQHLNPNAEFAFLSACETAKGDRNLPDEAIHLAAGMQLAGFRSVVATLWAMDDDAGFHLAKVFYREFFAGGARPEDAARALHVATQQLRKDGYSMLTWAPFIHMGI